MEYLKINDIDFSMYVNQLNISKNVNYNAQTNAAGNTVVDYINKKRLITVGIIPLDDVAMLNLQLVLDAFSVTVTFRNPQTNSLETVNCIIPSSNVEYYTIRADKVLFKAFTLEFIEL